MGASKAVKTAAAVLEDHKKGAAMLNAMGMFISFLCFIVNNYVGLSLKFF